jgi:hypothetical protein
MVANDRFSHTAVEHARAFSMIEEPVQARRTRKSQRELGRAFSPLGASAPQADLALHTASLVRAIGWR